MEFERRIVSHKKKTINGEVNIPSSGIHLLVEREQDGITSYGISCKSSIHKYRSCYEEL